MTRIEYVIVLEGPPEEVWPARKDLQTHVDGLKTEFEKVGLKVDAQWIADKSSSGGSNAVKLARFAGKGLKSGWDLLFKEEEKGG